MALRGARKRPWQCHWPLHLCPLYLGGMTEQEPTYKYAVEKKKESKSRGN